MSLKEYVDVVIYHRKDGQIKPLYIVWHNGVEYPIDKVMQITRAASLRAGGTGIRYTCLIQGSQRYLFLEEDRWFIEKKEEK
ncbi:MAG: hypothetical protein A2Y20_00260 [Firmicutes bacterium GWF2_51_9]|jgi:hypothetical protein|nr:MAG: hypothetical protein A2Y20_00260 [Firmicutes bacterium GWF2_51_9]OGS59025.1 MAG: hypothetical protein A2Y19_04485 [Firmicutes bacterium GWE2_51_13]HAM62858.1 hypothetical protein [Erysipelotrichaceae bacterium]HAO62099.1 hypothetical protein [Erysipelotrichaceae bacterium]HBZ40667.1 hypothetical protein [Erysipelotrichaceae bacterium]